MAENGSIEFHKNCLSNLCRICAKRVRTKQEIIKKVYPRITKGIKDEIYVFFGIDIENDEPDIHPNVICMSCYNKVKHNQNVDDLEKKHNLGVKEKTDGYTNLWKTHKRHNCQVCVLYTEQSKPGRQKKIKNNGRPQDKFSPQVTQVEHKISK